ncbi:dna mismatch repair [Pyrenophora seminiperda CCB06]|uniref:Dna mismatch repair n=1 Tax=Pyrenophora seminiperda CCB06 TaxID=1302712 RepID=A0A3M7MBZ5_9PLEO|nr:dna mismatch repair [Pyrenophora seminiperda CCB06]
MPFSTNANGSTRDNISNVYGAKAIAALIPLSLEFTMDPSNRPGATQSARNWSTQEDPGSRTVKIVGHISRPVVGEGRQTPDRQMFFVNSRPCTLPQVAKAFNEVYRSYNVTQSPFIFADIKLDTNAYDVNVSPDKRTIMLHDQTALLENLKNTLIELFEGQDQSMPQSQLLGKKTPTSAFRPPTMQPRESATTLSDEQFNEPESSDEVDQAVARNHEVTSPQDSPDVNPRLGFVKASLISRSAGRDSEERMIRPLSRRKIESISESSKTKEEHVLHPKALQRSASEESDAAESPLSRSQSPLFEPDNHMSNVPVRLSQPSRIVRDFNARVASHSPRWAQSVHSPGAIADVESGEQPIPAITHTPQKPLSQSTIQNAFDRMRPMRTPIQQATITVGNKTTVSTIGTGSQSVASKRSRIHTPRFSLSGKPLDQTPKNSRLRGFAAPGTRLESSDEDDERGDKSDEDDREEGDEEDEVMQDSIMSDAPTRSPSPHKRLPSRALEQPPNDDDLIVSTRAPPLRSMTVPEQDSDFNPMSDAEIEPPADPESSDDDDYMDETEKKALEEAKIAQLIASAEETATRPTDTNLKRVKHFLKPTQKKYWTLNLERVIETDVDAIARHAHFLQTTSPIDDTEKEATPSTTNLDGDVDVDDPEQRLNLTVTKSDFAAMRIVGQFNLGFIIAVRPPTPTAPSSSDLFIIDQHASDEKYNFERLAATTTLVSQRLVHPHPLELTAVEEEVILANEHALAANGFAVDLHNTTSSPSSSPEPTARRAHLISLPMSKEATFSPTDLEELIALLLDNPPSSASFSSFPSITTTTATASSLAYIPRPTKPRVQKLRHDRQDAACESDEGDCETYGGNG